MIIKDIYDGKSAKELSLTNKEYDERKETLDQFLETWDGKEFEDSFKLFVLELSNKKIIKPYSKKVVPKKINNKNNNDKIDLSYGKMFSNIAVSIKSIISSGIKTVDIDTHSTRYLTCLACSELTSNDRCKKCGCFMKLKTKFASMECPEGKWGKVLPIPQD